MSSYVFQNRSGCGTHPNHFLTWQVTGVSELQLSGMGRGLGIQQHLLCRSEMFFQLLLTCYRLIRQGQAWEDYRPCQHVQISPSPLLASGVRPCYSQCPPPAYPCPPALSSKSSPRLLGPRSAHTWMNLSKEVQGPEETRVIMLLKAVSDLFSLLPDFLIP